MNYRHITAAGFIVAASIASASAQEPRAVLELFTSQGCSSCPAADKLLGELSRDPSLIVLSLPVDYWDYLGWKDTLALHGHTSRERAYAKARGDREVYTPQVVVNGVAHVVGSDREAIENAIARTRNSAAPLKLPVTMSVVDGKVSVNVPAAGEQRSGEVWLCSISGKVDVAIERGENRGKTIAYTNVVRRWVKLGDWNGQAKTFSLPVTDLANGDFSLKDVDRVAVIVQGGVTAKPGVMLGAATASLR